MLTCPYNCFQLCGFAHCRKNRVILKFCFAPIIMIGKYHECPDTLREIFEEWLFYKVYGKRQEKHKDLLFAAGKILQKENIITVMDVEYNSPDVVMAAGLRHPDWYSNAQRKLRLHVHLETAAKPCTFTTYIQGSYGIFTPKHLHRTPATPEGIAQGIIAQYGIHGRSTLLYELPSSLLSEELSSVPQH